MSAAPLAALAALGRTRRLVRGLVVAVGVVLAAAWSAPALAHLMVAQKGTLNLSGDGAYLVLSLPVSALEGVDDDGDQLLSVNELRNHAGSIERQVQVGVRLLRDGSPLPLQGLMLNLSPPDEAPTAPARQIVVMGRFELGPHDAHSGDSTLTFALGLFGATAAEQVQDITFTRKPQSQAARYTPARTVHAVFPAASQVFIDYLRLGAGHVLGGLDHLLFLLVVLASLAGAGRGWRGVLLTLTCFTVGHAVALLASVWGGVSTRAFVAPTWVEPAIAATIVGMAAFDLLQRERSRATPPALHLGLVFACALVHGLGLASALGELGLSGTSLVWSLAGFNLGIELAQIGVASVAALAGAVLMRLAGPASLSPVARAASAFGIVAGTWWFIERAGGWV